MISTLPTDAFENGAHGRPISELYAKYIESKTSVDPPNITKPSKMPSVALSSPEMGFDDPLPCLHDDYPYYNLGGL